MDSPPTTTTNGSELHRRLELIVQNTTNMVVVTNAQREIEWVNPAFTRVTGWTLEEIKGRNPRSFLHGPRTSQVACARLRDLLLRRQPVVDFELLNYTKAGDPFWVSLNIVAIADDDGEVREYVAIQSDITERKRREAESAQMLRRLAEAKRLARLGFLEHDLSTGAMHCSTEIYRILDAGDAQRDLDYDELMSRTHPEDAPRVRERYEEAVNAGTPYESEHRIVSFAGRVKWVHMRGALEGWDDGTPAIYRLVVQDVTERRQAERTAHEKALLESAARAQREVLARVSHELRTPLHSVLGFAEMVERQEAARLSERSRDHLRHIRESARHLLLIVNDILELAHVSDGRVSLELRPVELRALVNDAVAMLEPMAAQRGIAVRVRAPRRPLYASADRRRLLQVLINLAGNAIKHNEAPCSVRVEVSDPGDGMVALSVVDDGDGIAPEHLERLFEPFYRVARSAAGESGGLGLPIAKTLAEAMGGSLRVHSRPGAGSRFTVSLARAQAGPQPAAGPEPARAADGDGDIAGADAGKTGTRGRLLYVEDDEVHRLLVQSCVEARPGIELTCCATGAQALELARQVRPTLILADMHLPDTSGRELIAAIQEDPELARTPCIAFSADADERAADAAIRAGFREYLRKPIDAAAFLEALDRLMVEDALATRA